MTVTNISRAGLIAKQVEIEAVTLRDANLSSTVNPLDTPAELALQQEYRARFERPTSSPEHLFVYVDFRFSAREVVEGVDRAGGALELTATYLLLYRFVRPDEQPEDALGYFAELNGVYNAWPYWREMVQTVSGRVGLTSIVVPVFRPPSKRIEEESAPAANGPPPKKTRKATRKAPSK
jgi:hypothetical protein